MKLLHSESVTNAFTTSFPRTFTFVVIYTSWCSATFYPYSHELIFITFVFPSWLFANACQHWSLRNHRHSNSSMMNSIFVTYDPFISIFLHHRPESQWHTCASNANYISPLCEISWYMLCLLQTTCYTYTHYILYLCVNYMIHAHYSFQFHVCFTISNYMTYLCNCMLICVRLQVTYQLQIVVVLRAQVKLHAIQFNHYK